MTLPEFLRDRIAEDEAEIGPASDCDCDVIGLPLRHGVRCPVRMLAECEAKRRIVNLEMPSHYVGAECDGWWEAHDLVLCYLALPDADHADYDEAWRP